MPRCWFTALVALPMTALAGGLQPVDLPPAQDTGGKPLMEALAHRKSSRDFRAARLPAQTLADLLWAGAGVNRADGRRTAPSASNRQEVDIYVATADGVFLYQSGLHRLDPILAGDLRGATGTQSFVKDAPVNLIYVADFARMGNSREEEKKLYSAADTGFISQNVYLYCASAGLATVVRGSVDRATLGKILHLRPEQRIVLAQSVGYPR